MKPLFRLILGTLTLAAPSVYAGEIGKVNVTGFVGIESRVFLQDGRFDGQSSDTQNSIIISPEFRYKTEDRRHQFAFLPFFRLDGEDNERTHADIREAYWLWRGDEFEILTGLNKVFWGVAESRHLVNIINQTDAVEDLDGEDYLVQPMINLSTQRDWGQVDFFVLPGFRERTFAGKNGRFRGPLTVDDKNPNYESGAEEHHIDFAARYSHYFAEWDVGLSHFYGTGREPRLLLNAAGTELEPYYDLINQTGVDLQYTGDAWLWKLESIVRSGQGDRFIAAVGGFEYTFYQILEKDWDLGILSEYQYDNRDASAPITTQDRDIFAGFRLALNDIQDSELLAGVSIDTKTGEKFFSLEAERRIGDNYDIELRARFFTGADRNEKTYPLEQDDYLQIRFSRYF